MFKNLQRKNRIVAAILAVAVLLSLVGCGSPKETAENSEAATKPNSETVETSVQASGKAVIDPFGEDVIEEILSCLKVSSDAHAVRVTFGGKESYGVLNVGLPEEDPRSQIQYSAYDSISADRTKHLSRSYAGHEIEIRASELPDDMKEEYELSRTVYHYTVPAVEGTYVTASYIREHSELNSALIQAMKEHLEKAVKATKDAGIVDDKMKDIDIDAPYVFALSANEDYSNYYSRLSFTVYLPAGDAFYYCPAEVLFADDSGETFKVIADPLPPVMLYDGDAEDIKQNAVPFEDVNAWAVGN